MRSKWPPAAAERRAAVVHQLDDVLLLGEAAGDVLPDGPVVLDDQDLHGEPGRRR